MNPRVVDPDTTTPPGVLPFSQREFALVLGALLKRLAPVEEGRPEPREVAPRVRSDLLRKASPRSALLRRSHPGGPSHRPGLYQTYLPHIGADRFAVDVRTPSEATRILVSTMLMCHRRASGGDEDQC